jgi:hypothetical protein
MDTSLPFLTDDAGKPKRYALGPAQAFATLVEGMDKSLGDVLDHLDTLGVAETRSSSSWGTTVRTRRSAISTKSRARLRCAARKAPTTKAARACRSLPRGRRPIRRIRFRRNCRLP